MSNTMRSRPARLTARRAITLVARREFNVQVVKKSFLVSNTIVVLAIVGGIVGFSLFSSGDDDPRIGLVGAAASLSAPLVAAGEALGTPVETIEVGDEATARTNVAAGDVEVAVLSEADGAVSVIVDSELEPELRAVLETTVAGQAQRAALETQGVDPDQLAQDTAGAVVNVDALDPPDPDSGQRTVLAFVAVFLLYGQLIGFGLYVAMGVVEEKSSRVVELLLSTIRPLHLLWGKILGIGAVGLLQLALYGAVGLIAGAATGVLTVTGTAVGVFASVLGWFILGFGFFAVLYAAAGSMVSRQEDINSTTGPLLMLILVMFGTGFYAVGEPEGTLSNVLSWIPPFTAILMPLRVAAGVTTPLQIVATAVLMLAVTIALAVLAAKIYQRSILRTGTQVSWREALGRTRTAPDDHPTTTRPDGTSPDQHDPTTTHPT